MKKKKIKSNTISIGRYIFYIAYILYFFYYIVLRFSTYGLIVKGNVITVVKGFIYLLFVVKIMIYDKHTIKELVLYLSFFLILFIAYWFNKDIRFIEMFLIIMATKNIDEKKITRLTLISLICFSLFVVCSAIAKIIPNYVFSRGTTGKLRYSLGFFYVSQLAFFSREIIFILFLNVKEKKILKVSVFAFIIAFITYNITDVRNVYITSIVLILCILVYTYRKNILKKKIVRKMISASIIVCMCLSLFFVFRYSSENQFYVYLNKKLSTRLSIGSRMFERYEIKPFGNKIDMYGVSAITNNKKLTWKDYSYIDVLFYQLLLKDGFLIFILFIVLYTKVLYRSINDSKYRLFGIWFFIIAISSLVTDEAIVVLYNFPIIFINQILSDNKESTTELKNKNKVLSI